VWAFTACYRDSFTFFFVLRDVPGKIEENSANFRIACAKFKRMPSEYKSDPVTLVLIGSVNGH
jgi:hypothetical protein